MFESQLYERANKFKQMNIILTQETHQNNEVADKLRELKALISIEQQALADLQ